jgi:sn-glycerol 3-phosphate transport system substrate-binding protein
MQGVVWMRITTWRLIVFIFALGVQTLSFAEQKELLLWHTHDGFLEKKLHEIANHFNLRSKDFRVVVQRQGNYSETFEKALKAHQEGKGPHLLQVYEIATQTMILQPKTFVPIEELFRKYSKEFSPDEYIDVVRNYYSTSDGKMLSFPWNTSTAALYYNKNAFRTAGLDPDKPPKTWEELEEMSKTLVEHGIKGFTNAWPCAYHLEHFCCIHNIPFASHSNGFEGLQARLVFNQNKDVIEHIEKLCAWQKTGVFAYGGRENRAEELFTSGSVGIFLQRASRIENLKRKANFEIGVGYYPYSEKLTDSPYNLNIEGSSLWALSGFTDKEYQGVIEFLSFVASPEIQANWHMTTTFLPITKKGYEIAQASGYYEKNPIAKIAIFEVLKRPGAEFTKGLRLGNYISIRNLIIDHLEQAFSSVLSAQDAVDYAATEGNKLLAQFEAENSL